MTLQEIVQILSGVGVIASMIFVGIQIRNNARAVRASTFLQLSHTLIGSLINMANNGDLTEIVLRGGDDFAALPRLAKARFRFHSMFVLSFNQNVFQQHKIGALHADDWNSFSADLVSYFDMKGAREVWPGIRRRFNPDFQTHVEQIIAKAELEKSEVIHPFGSAKPSAKPQRRKPTSKPASKT